jgi:hypothetical protein
LSLSLDQAALSPTEPGLRASAVLFTELQLKPEPVGKKHQISPFFVLLLLQKQLPEKKYSTAPPFAPGMTLFYF